MTGNRPCTSDTHRCEFWTWGDDYVRPDCCTNHLVEIAVFVHRALSERAILHWLDYGSLLGAVRGQHLIPWDSDVDFGYLAEDHELVVDALEAAAAATPLVVDLRAKYVTRVNVSALNDQHADLYPWHRVGDVLEIRDAGAGWPGTAEPDSFPIRFVDRLDPVRLEGHRFPAPAPVHEFLERHRYGPDYLVPLRRPVDRPLAAPTSWDELTPSVRALFAELMSLPDEDRGPLAHALARTSARGQTDLQELEGRSPRGRLRRTERSMARRVRRLLRRS